MLHALIVPSRPGIGHSIPGRIVGMTLAYLVQHGEKEGGPGDPGLTRAGRQQAARTGRWLRGRGVRTLFSSPVDDLNVVMIASISHLL
jgi:hypothetical protein